VAVSPTWMCIDSKHTVSNSNSKNIFHISFYGSFERSGDTKSRLTFWFARHHSNVWYERLLKISSQTVVSKARLYLPSRGHQLVCHSREARHHHAQGHNHWTSTPSMYNDD
jgi:hypothetical protein